LPLRRRLRSCGKDIFGTEAEPQPLHRETNGIFPGYFIEQVRHNIVLQFPFQTRVNRTLDCFSP
jgi:hypothetical protein